MKKLGKKAITLTPNEIIELILVIAGMFLLIVAFLAFTNPGFDTNKETAKSYFATLEKEIQKADNGETGEFELWSSKAAFVMIYFGNSNLVSGGDLSFAYLKNGKNVLCICYVLKQNEKYKTFCDYCIDLKYPAWRIPNASKDWVVTEKWVVSGNERVSIELARDSRTNNENTYIFTTRK